jgi:hypothetical protein
MARIECNSGFQSPAPSINNTPAHTTPFYLHLLPLSLSLFLLSALTHTHERGRRVVVTKLGVHSLNLIIQSKPTSWQSLRAARGDAGIIFALSRFTVKEPPCSTSLCLGRLLCGFSMNPTLTLCVICKEVWPLIKIIFEFRKCRLIWN